MTMKSSSKTLWIVAGAVGLIWWMNQRQKAALAQVQLPNAVLGVPVYSPYIIN
jgi:hypothetical protein